MCTRTLPLGLFASIVLSMGVGAFLVTAQAGPTTSTVTAQPSVQTATPAPDAVEDTWPRVFKRDSGTVTVYPPSFQSWSGTSVTGTCAIAISSADGKSQSFGTMAFTAATEVNKLNRIVEVSAIKVTGISLPENPAGQAAIMNEVEKKSEGRVVRIALDRFEAAVPAMAVTPSAPSAPLMNNPPALSIVSTATVLVPVQGQPVLQPFSGTDLSRVVNTPMLLMKDQSGSFWLKIADGWMVANSLAGPWSVSSAGDAGLAKAAQWAQSQPTINLLAPAPSTNASASNNAQTASLASSAPTIVVSTVPAEILVTEGAPQWQPIADSGLLYVSNTSANIFQLKATATMYVLVSGRWFTAPAMSGPWAYVPSAQLPAAFMMIPQDSPKENVLASIPGSAQAQEAMIANSIPQMARVPLTQQLPLPAINGGGPDWKSIPGTSVQVVANCATPLFKVSSGSCFAVQNGVWFTAPKIDAPWTVASSVSTDIYTIPPSSPYYYVTFVRVYSATPSYVLVGYTPGYFGSYTQDGVVVYGTGYAYDPYYSSMWVPVPMTYGCGASMCYNPWAGWAVGFGAGMAVGWAVSDENWHCGPYPYWGPYNGAYGAHGAYAWGPGGWAATTGNVYHQWGDVNTMSRSSAGYNAWTGNAWAGQTGASYNSATGAVTAGQRGYVQNAYTGNWAEGARGAGYNPTTGNYAAGKGVTAGTAGNTDVAAGKVTVGNTNTGNSATAAGVKTDNGSWGAVQTENGTTVEHNGNVYGMNDGNAYRRDDATNSWQRYDNNGNWNRVNDENMNRSLDQQSANRANGDQRAQNSNRWQSGGEGFTGVPSSGNPRGWTGGSSYGNSGNRGGRSGGGGGGRR